MEEPGKVGNARCLKVPCIGEAATIWGLDMDAEERNMYIYVYTPFPSQQHVVCSSTATNILLGTVGAAEQVVQPQINYC